MWWLFSHFFKSADNLTALQEKVNQLQAELQRATHQLKVKGIAPVAKPLVGTSTIPTQVRVIPCG